MRDSDNGEAMCMSSEPPSDGSSSFGFDKNGFILILN
jgi:hypothetical protein